MTVIYNPNPVVPVREKDDLEQLTGSEARAQIIVKNYRKFLPDPDRAVDRVMGILDTKVVNLDAKILETGYRPGRPPRIHHYRSLREFAASPTFRRRVRDHYRMSDVREAGERLIEAAEKMERRNKKDLKTRLKESRFRREEAKAREAISGPGQFNSYGFEFGMYPDELTNPTGVSTFPLQDTFLPSANSPYAKQMLWVDYQLMHRQCFEAATKNPLGKRIVKIIPQFVIGRGVAATIKDKEKQKIWNEFWKRNKMKLRVKQILRELITYGEIFNRYFLVEKNKLAIRSVDPSTIWDIVTNPDDLEDVYYYHQQYMISMNSPVQSIRNLVPATLIIRQIPAPQIDHFKINSTFSEKRGRSELYAILGWLVRYKEFMNDRVLLNKMRAMFALDVKVTGGKKEVDEANAQFSAPPGPGATVVHNESVDINFKGTNTGAMEASTDAEAILKVCAVGAGVSENFLGVSKDQTRAGALISTEPDVKNFEDYQEIMEEMLYRASDRQFAISFGETDVTEDEMEFTFPSIAAEERSGKLKDIALAEAMDWFSKTRAATMAAKEFQINTYDRNAEENQIKKERNAPVEGVMAQAFATVPKVPMFPDEQAMMGGMEDPSMMDDPNQQQDDGSGVPPPGGPPDDQGRPISHQSASMGFPPDTGGRNLPNTKATLNRSSFTKGSEKEAVKGNKSSGKKSKNSIGIRASGLSPRRGWSPAAREAALNARREKRDRRLREQRGEETES